MAAADSEYEEYADDADDADDVDDADDADDADDGYADCGCGNRSRSKRRPYNGVDCCHRHNSQAHNWKYRSNQHNKGTIQH